MAVINVVVDPRSRLVNFLRAALVITLVSLTISLVAHPRTAGAGEPLRQPAAGLPVEPLLGGSTNQAAPGGAPIDQDTGRPIWDSSGGFALPKSIHDRALSEGRGGDFQCADGRECP